MKPLRALSGLLSQLRMDLTRRSFLALLPALAGAAPRELRCDLAIIGAGVGGCAAALAALRVGMRVVLTEETDWVGGQLTSQAVPPDEHPWIESFGGTQLYRTYRDDVREYYRRYYPLLSQFRREKLFNPGGGSVSRLTHEPRVSLAVLENLLAPYLSSGALTLLLQHRPVQCSMDGDWVRSVTCRSLLSGEERTVIGKYVLDATEQGDLLPLSKTEFVTGSESQKQTGEPHAQEIAKPNNIQSFTVCFAIDYVKGENHVIDKPADYPFWRDYVPVLNPAWSGKLLSWAMSNPITLAKRELGFNPEGGSGSAGVLNLWEYRKIASRSYYPEGNFPSDISLVNWPQNDYWLGNLHGGTDQDAAKHLRGGKQLSLSLLYWMQTEAPRPDGGAGWPGLRLRPDVTGTEDGLAKYPYIRESRRIQAEFTVVEQHVATSSRKGAMLAQKFDDSVGVGSYRIDLHPSSGGDNYIDVSSLPFQIPLGALLPKRVENLLPACKNLGVTHITNGCYRLHPVEWNIGEAAGALAAFCVKTNKVPRHVRATSSLFRDFQRSIQAQGVETDWPQLTPR